MKRRRRIFGFVLITAIFVSGGYFFYLNLGRNRMASLQIVTQSQLPVFVDGRQVSAGSWEGVLPPRPTDVRVGDFETRVGLVRGVKTVIRRNFEEDVSYGETLSFEETGVGEADLAVVSSPLGASVVVDGDKLYGTTPVVISDLGEGKHKVEVSYGGYRTEAFFVNLVKRYRMTAFVDLIQNKQVSLPTPLPQQTVYYVRILTTPNGFLRVRKEPNTTSEEIGRARDGERYLFIEQDKKTNWYKIQFDATRVGYVSDTYAAKEN